MNRKSILRGKHRIILTDNFGSCDKDIDLSNKEKLIKSSNILGVESNAYDDIQKSGCKMDVLDLEGRSIIRSRQIFRAISDEIALIVFPENPTFHLQNVNIQEAWVFNTIQDNFLDLMFFGRHDISVTSAIVIATSFKLKYAHAFVEDQYSKSGEDRAASVSKGKRKISKERFSSLYNTYKVLSSGGSFPKHNYMFRIDASKVV